MTAVDVGVVTYNTRDLTLKALRQLLDSEQGCSLRVLVWDNASSDGTPEMLRHAVPQAEVHCSDRNLGFAAGMNALLRRSGSPWFLALNSDAWPDPGAVGRLLDAGERHPRAAAVAPRIVGADGRLEHSTHPFPSPTVAAVVGLGLDRLLPRRVGRRLLLHGAWDHDRARRVDWAIGAALLMRTEAVRSIGGFDERFFMYAEDLEWCWRASRQGWQVWFEPSALVHHVGNASGARTYGRARTAAHLSNTYRFYRSEHGPMSTFAYRAFNVVGCSRQYLRARRQHRHDLAEFWGDHLRAHLSRAGSDRPPGGGSA